MKSKKRLRANAIKNIIVKTAERLSSIVCDDKTECAIKTLKNILKAANKEAILKGTETVAGFSGERCEINEKTAKVSATAKNIIIIDKPKIFDSGTKKPVLVSITFLS